MIDKIFSLIADYDNHIKTIDKIHYEVHEGDHYTFSKSTTIVGTSTYYIALTTPNTTVEPHLIFSFDAAAVATLQFYENATIASTWAANTVYNNNRRSTNAATVVIRASLPSSDVTSTGTLLETIGLPAGYVKTDIGISGTSRNEWVLQKNYTYLARITSASTNSIDANFMWYED